MGTIDQYQISLKLLLQNENNEILALGARDDGIFAGYHDLPGGRIDQEEFTTPIEQILLREVYEEIGNVNITINPMPIAVGRALSIQDTPEKYFTSGLLEAIRMYNAA